LTADANQLIQNDFRPIRGWSIVIFLAVLPLLLVPGLWLLRDREMLAMLALFFISSLIALAVAVAPMGWRALPALGFRPAGFWPIVLGAVGALIVSVAVSQLGIEPEGVKQAMDVARTPALFVASLAVMALLAPLVEEVVFRGLLYGWVAGRWGVTAAWFVSSILFAAAHVEPAHALLVLPLGLWFGWLRQRTDSLWPSLVAHMANNGLAVVAAALINTTSP
jgi:membrane protease YdiL (CAAX protease family)